MLRRVTQVQDAALAPYRDVGNPAALARKGLCASPSIPARTRWTSWWPRRSRSARCAHPG